MLCSLGLLARQKKAIAAFYIHNQTPAPQPPQPFYGPFSRTTRVSRYEKRTSGLYGARED